MMVKLHDGGREKRAGKELRLPRLVKLSQSGSDEQLY